MFAGYRRGNRDWIEVGLDMADALELPKGFEFGFAQAGIKYPNRKDVGLLYSQKPASCAAVFTKNLFAAAPVHFSRAALEKAAGFVSGVIVNSGCANAATGSEGDVNAERMAVLAQEGTGAGAPVLVSSTGTIGVQLPMDRLSAGITEAAVTKAAGAEAFIAFADSIMTTDTVRKVASDSFAVDGKRVAVAGCAKGSGMMHPNMATMLAYVFTDAEIEPRLLQQIFVRIIERTLNCVTVDGDTSTNDTAVVLANGAAEVDIVPDTPAFHGFETALTNVLKSLAKQLARDGEGATHLVEVTVNGAPDFFEARKAALAVANSPLVKTAIYGRDANWGRIACALGNSGVEFDASKTDISLGGIELMREGSPVDFSEEKALDVLKRENIEIVADLKAGTESATVWTCDLTEKYIEINGSYRT